MVKIKLFTFGLLFALAMVLVRAPALAQGAAGPANISAPEKELSEEIASGEFVIRPIRTDSPRSTLATFLRLREELEQALLAYRIDKTAAIAIQVRAISAQFTALLDLSSIPQVSRREIAVETTGYLLDILGRVELPALDSVPDHEAFDDDVSPAKWRIPQTPLWIIRLDDGPREGEFIFSERTVQSAPRFYQGIQNLPLESALDIESWNRAIPQLTGPMIPAAVLRAVPMPLRELWMDTPKWKILAVIIVSVIMAGLLIVFHRLVNRHKPDGKIRILLRRALTPAAVLVAVFLVGGLIASQIGLSGDFSGWVASTEIVIIHLATLWLVWLLVLALFERVIQLRNIPAESFDAHLWRLSGRALGSVIGVTLIAKGAQTLGLPIYSVVAGLGIGGIAVALAIRPTLENLIGGIILYLDQPIRVGDFCSFGDKTGTIESIGVRTTKLRSVDRTVISVPNSTLADMQLINWAKCDMMLITVTIGLRYETEPDQMRHVLVKFREMLHAHPKIDTATVRVRFSGFGASSLDIGVRVYALTRDFNEFHAIREDVFLRMIDIVKESGSSFAFPSQTLYMGRDEGLDNKLGEAATRQVNAWRKAGQLPFPRLGPDRAKELEDTLDYPPKGSIEAGVPESQQVWDTAEQLSSEPVEPEEPEELPESEESKRKPES